MWLSGSGHSVFFHWQWGAKASPLVYSWSQTTAKERKCKREKEALKKDIHTSAAPHVWHTDLVFVRYTVSLDLRFGNDNSVTNQDPPAVCGIVNHHNDARLLAVHHPKCTEEQKKTNKPPSIMLLLWSMRWARGPEMKNSQGHATLRCHAKHHLAQGRHPDIEAVCEGGESARLDAADAARWRLKLRRRARTQSRRVEVRKHRA